jgi:hypothetical protein
MSESYFDLTFGTDYTVSGNTVTLTERSETESFNPWHYADKEVFVDYTYSLTTENPIGGIGDALIQAMNPIHIIYECLTNREWGRGLPRTSLGPSWEYAAEKCFAERFGLCIRWVRNDEIQSFIQSVLDHIGAALYDNRRTGKIEIALIRDDYTRENVPFFDRNSGLLEIRDAAVSTPVSMVNEVQVTYRDPVTDEDRTVRAANLASIQASGGAVKTITKSYPGLPTAELAARVALRDLRALSPAIRRFTVVLDRRGHNVYPGGVIRVQDLSRQIPDTVLRVATVDYGRLGEGRIEVTAMQDVFALPRRGFTTIGPPQYKPIPNKPCVGDRFAFEMPYRSLYRSMKPAEFDYVPDTAAYLAVVAQQGRPTNRSYTLAVRDGAPEAADQPPDDSYVCGV